MSVAEERTPVAEYPSTLTFDVLFQTGQPKSNNRTDNIMDRPLPLDMLYRWERECPDFVYMSQPIHGEWRHWTWKETGREVRKMAAYLKSLNYEPGSKIAVISKNCAHWIISDLAIQMAGYCGVPLYPNLGPDTLRQILQHSESKLLFVGKLDDWASMRPGVPDGMKCIAFPFYTEPI